MVQCEVEEVSMQDPFLLDKAANIVEVICNLNYLIREEAGDAEKIRYYTDLSDGRVKALITLLGGDTRN